MNEIALGLHLTEPERRACLFLDGGMPKEMADLYFDGEGGKCSPRERRLIKMAYVEGWKAAKAPSSPMNIEEVSG